MRRNFLPKFIEICMETALISSYYSVTNSTGATQRFSSNHKTSSEQKNRSSFISGQSPAITNGGLAAKCLFPSTKRQLNIYWKAPRKTLGGPGWIRYTVNIPDDWRNPPQKFLRWISSISISFFNFFKILCICALRLLIVSSPLY